MDKRSGVAWRGVTLGCGMRGTCFSDFFFGYFVCSCSNIGRMRLEWAACLSKHVGRALNQCLPIGPHGARDFGIDCTVMHRCTARRSRQL